MLPVRKLNPGDKIIVRETWSQKDDNEKTAPRRKVTVIKQYPHHVVVVILAAIVTGVLFWALCGKAAWFIGHDDGQAYERYMESMMENGMYPDIYGYGWGKE